MPCIARLVAGEEKHTLWLPRPRPSFAAVRCNRARRCHAPLKFTAIDENGQVFDTVTLP
jgi:hypothetical protein